MGEKLSCFLAF